MECMLVHISQLDCEVIMKILQRGAFFSNREVVLLLLASPFGEVESTERQLLETSTAQRNTQEYVGICRKTTRHTQKYRGSLWRRAGKGVTALYTAYCTVVGARKVL